MDYYLAPGKSKNIDKSILNNINDKIGNVNQDEDIFAWGITTNNKCKGYSKSISVDDKFCIYPTNIDKNVLYIGKVVGKINNADLAKKIWGQGDDVNYSCVVLLKDISEIKISKKDLYNKLNYKRICGVTKLSSYRRSKINEMINEVPSKTKKSYDFQKLKIELVEKFWNTDDFEFQIVYNRRNSKIGKKKMKKVSKGHSSDISVEFPSKLVGWTGEKILYKALNSRISRNKDISLLSKFNITITNNTKLNVIWFNSELDIKDPDAEDCSVGKGYDLEVKINERKLKLEVKSSINNLDIITLTRNELIEMKNSGNDYFLVLVDNFKNKARIRFVKNFSELIKEEYISMSLEHKLWINQLDEHYFI